MTNYEKLQQQYDKHYDAGDMELVAKYSLLIANYEKAQRCTKASKEGNCYERSRR